MGKMNGEGKLEIIGVLILDFYKMWWNNVRYFLRTATTEVIGNT